jgi:hypothetical protein
VWLEVKRLRAAVLPCAEGAVELVAQMVLADTAVVVPVMVEEVWEVAEAMGVRAGDAKEGAVVAAAAAVLG